MGAADRARNWFLARKILFIAHKKRANKMWGPIMELVWETVKVEVSEQPVVIEWTVPDEETQFAMFRRQTVKVSGTVSNEE